MVPAIIEHATKQHREVEEEAFSLSYAMAPNTIS